MAGPMGRWNGCEVERDNEVIRADAVYEVLDATCRVLERPTSAPMRAPMSGIHGIKGVGNVPAGHAGQGVVKPGEESASLRARAPLRARARARGPPWRCTAAAQTFWTSTLIPT